MKKWFGGVLTKANWDGQQMRHHGAIAIATVNSSLASLF
jgi:hypothetical protein